MASLTVSFTKSQLQNDSHVRQKIPTDFTQSYMIHIVYCTVVVFTAMMRFFFTREREMWWLLLRWSRMWFSKGAECRCWHMGYMGLCMLCVADFSSRISVCVSVLLTSVAGSLCVCECVDMLMGFGPGQRVLMELMQWKRERESCSLFHH